MPALIIANIALAIGPWLVRIARVDGHVGPIGSGFWRLTLALPILLIAMRRESGVRPVNMRTLLFAALMSGLFFAADLAAWHLGILHTRLSNATLLGNVTAILFPIYGFIVARSLPSRRQGLALLLALCGAGLLLGRSYELSARNLLGDLFCLVAGVCYTGYLVFADRARSALGPITTLTWSVAAGIPILLVVALAADDPIWPDLWWPLILMTLGSQIIGQGLILYAVSRVSALVVGLMLLLQPIVAATIGWLAYGERLTAFDYVGGLAIAAAVLLVRGAERPLPAAQISLSA
ncbi:DMT family transporter [Sphingomonas sp. ASY06-1R]|uniref:DMT family transporter n=1 Tax=Sphingomonas sp. ASY06-1R TaxID=3445771 RepID=UPI003FA25520